MREWLSLSSDVYLIPTLKELKTFIMVVDPYHLYLNAAETAN